MFSMGDVEVNTSKVIESDLEQEVSDVDKVGNIVKTQVAKTETFKRTRWRKPCSVSPEGEPGTTTSEPDMVLYSDRTSDTLMGDCKYSMGRQVRDTGYNFWEVED